MIPGSVDQGPSVPLSGGSSTDAASDLVAGLGEAGPMGRLSIEPP